MRVKLTPTFLDDLRTIDDVRLHKKIYSDVFDERGHLKADRADHRYRGIEGAWIRHLTGGRSAFRLIYIQRDDIAYLYRVGPHSIEENLTGPRSLDGAVDVSGLSDAFASTAVRDARETYWVDDGRLLRSSQPLTIGKVMASMRWVKQTEIWLVSPFISESVLARTSPFGQFLDRMVEDGATVWLITRPPQDRDKLPFYRSLEERRWAVFLHKALHSKLYVFEVDETALGPFTKDVRRTAILGSANLTEMGLAMSGEVGNEELCYQMPLTKYDEAKQYAYWLAEQSDDVATYISRVTRRF